MGKSYMVASTASPHIQRRRTRCGMSSSDAFYDGCQSIVAFLITDRYLVKFSHQLVGTAAEAAARAAACREQRSLLGSHLLLLLLLPLRGLWVAAPSGCSNTSLGSPTPQQRALGQVRLCRAVGSSSTRQAWNLWLFHVQLEQLGFSFFNLKIFFLSGV